MATTASSFTIEIPPEVKLDPQIDVQLATLDSQALTRSEQVRAMVITDYDSYLALVAQGRIIATGISELKSYRERITAPLYVPLDRLRGSIKSVLDVMEGDKDHCSKEVGRWEAEVDRQITEANQIAAQEQRKRDEESKIQAAIKAEEGGLKPAAVEQILSSPVTTAPAPYYAMPQRAPGRSGRKPWKLYPKNPDNLAPDAAEAVAFRQLVVAAAEDPKLMCFLQRNVSLCDSEAKKGQLCQIPGYEALQDNRTSFRKV